MSAPNRLDLAMRTLAMHKDFRLFLLHVARLSNIFTPTAGAEQTLLFREGQRSLGLDIFRLAAGGLRRGATIEDMIALVLSEATPKETDDEPTESERS